MLQRSLLTMAISLVAGFVVPEGNAGLPKCDYSNSIRVGSRTFEICSWTRVGTESVGLLQVAVVSKDGIIDIANYEIYGVISDVGISDLDDDKSPELHILVESPDSSRYPELHLLELTDDELQERSLPEMTSLQAHGYMGRDRFTFDEKRLVREFPIFDSNETGARPSGGNRRLIYKLRDTRLVLESRIDTDPEPLIDSSK